MRILLIKPPVNPNIYSPDCGEPLELEYLAASVSQHQVSILDMRIDRNLHKKLDTFKPHLVGITAYTCDANISREILKEVKKNDHRINTVIGGHHATFLPGYFATPYIDAVFLGIADNSFPTYVNVLDQGDDIRNVPNIGIVDDENIIFTDKTEEKVNLDTLPLPDRRLVRHYQSHYLDLTKKRTAYVLTSRGCPFRCTFCACWKMMNGKYRIRQPESIIEEILSLPEDVKLIRFADDNTLQNIPRAQRLCELLKEKNNKKEITMYARTDLIVKHPDLIENFRNAGLKHITVGIEEFRDERLDQLNKKTSVNINNKAIRILHNLDIRIGAHFIIHPDFTRKDFRQLYGYVTDNHLYRPVYTILTPLPGTDLYEETKEHLVNKNFDFYDFVHCVYPTTLPRNIFYPLLVKIYKMSYGFPRYMLSYIQDAWHFLHRKKKKFSHVDRLSLLSLAIVRLFSALKLYRLKRAHRTEPVRSAELKSHIVNPCSEIRI